MGRLRHFLGVEISMSDIFNLDPLVLLNVSDHITRSKHRKGGNASAVGILLGEEDAAVDSLQIEANDSSVNSEIVTTRLSIYSQIYPKLLPIGFYSTCTASESLLRSIGATLGKNELYWLHVDGTMIYVHEYHFADSTIHKTNIQHSVRGTDPTTIALRDVWNTSTGRADISRRCTESIIGLGMSYETLLSKMSLLKEFVNNVDTGACTADPETLLEISSLVTEFNNGLIAQTSGEEEEVARAVVRLAKATDIFTSERLRPGNNK